MLVGLASVCPAPADCLINDNWKMPVNEVASAPRWSFGAPAW